MPRPNLPYLNCERTRWGKLVWYVRVGKGKRTRIKAPWGSPEFMGEYYAATSGQGSKAPPRARKDTFAWAEAMYRESSAWSDLKPATQRQRRNILKKIVVVAGDQPLSAFTRAKIVEGRERRKDTPAAARHFIETLGAFFRWAVERELVASNPTEGVKLPRKSSTGIPVWTEDDIAAYEARWPMGTRERLALVLLLETGLRRGDACALGRQHVKDGVARLTTEKTGERVSIPITPELAEAIAKCPIGELTYIAGENRQRFTKESFGNWFRECCRAAGVTKSAHGLRKAAATRAANAGFSEAQLEARFGWRGGRMASLYTKSMDREKLSLDAQKKIK